MRFSNDAPKLPQRTCRHCRHWAYQQQHINGEFDMHPHCAKWLVCFPDATHCRDYEREPGSDDEL